MNTIKNKITRTLQGKVVSNKMNKTIVVSVVRKIKHPKYGKYINKSLKIHAHDEKNVSRVGDKVVIIESRPISKKKRWCLMNIVKDNLTVGCDI